MRLLKRCLVLLLCLFSLITLSGCQDSTEAEIAKLEKEAAKARQKANEAQEKVRVLEALIGE